MNKADKKFTLWASVAGGFIAGGTLLVYQLALGWGWGVLLAGLVAIIAGLAIAYLAKRKLLK